MASNLQRKSQELTTEKAKPFHQSFGNANISTYKRMKLHHHTQKLIQNEESWMYAPKTIDSIETNK